MSPPRQLVIALMVAGMLGLGLLAVAVMVAMSMLKASDTSDFVPVDVQTLATAEPGGTRITATVVASTGGLPDDLTVSDREQDPRYLALEGTDPMERSGESRRSEVTVSRVDERTARVSYLVGPRPSGRQIVVVDSPIEKTTARSVDAEFTAGVESCVQPDYWPQIDSGEVWAKRCASGTKLKVEQESTQRGPLMAWFRVVIQ